MDWLGSPKMIAKFVLSNKFLVVFIFVVFFSLQTDDPIFAGKINTPICCPLDVSNLNTDPFVKQIRSDLDAFLAKESDEFAPLIIDAHLYKDYYHGKFKVMDIQPAQFGGKEIEIVFIDKPDKIFWTWVYCVDSDEYQLRAISDQNYTSEFMELIRRKYRDYLSDFRYLF
jgi:hypothetical protein